MIDKLQVGDLVKVVKVVNYGVTLGALCGKFGLVMETEISRSMIVDGPVALVFVDKRKWWLPYEKLEKISNG